MSQQPKVLVCGPSSWNQLVELDHLPEPRPQQLFARGAWRTVGGTSAGKALHLSSLDIATELFTQVAGDESGRALRRALLGAGINLQVVPSASTEQHINLMAGGQRVSVYLAAPSAPAEADVDAVCAAVRESDLAVIDLSELGLRVIERLREPAVPLWVDLHDFDGFSSFHQPFLGAASVVFMNDDATSDPWELLAGCLRRGPSLAVCTLGEQGAVALDLQGRRWEVAAPKVEVVDTNGAGDAFMAGFLAARLRGAPVQASMEAAASSAAVALSSRHLHPKLAHLPA
ncbi:carbohydrate kinase family protein [Glutamicibacter halophytocola]|uniref:Carbohydrate kinase family protein n=1 Tax=Glutamicibacter halophytocola TaxID=1933880 RepID=A0ABX5Y4W8_9MICC|nr:carbohydrate kinase family protein [Glutamicibacter halophytocola]QDY65138.1 carbohydrate kinase family protein [Glutamicibacter halophytocola]